MSGQEAAENQRLRAALDAKDAQIAGQQAEIERLRIAWASARTGRAAARQQLQDGTRTIYASLVQEQIGDVVEERDRLREAEKRVRHLHHPTLAKHVKPCGTHHSRTVCSNCEVEEFTVCAQMGCHGWPCETLIALDQETT